MEDFNAKVGGACHKNWPSVGGKFGVGNGNERGEKMLQLCAINNLSVVKTLA